MKNKYITRLLLCLSFVLLFSGLFLLHDFNNSSIFCDSAHYYACPFPKNANFSWSRGITDDHFGIDYGAPPGTSTYATHGGKVVDAGDSGGSCGWRVSILHYRPYFGEAEGGTYFIMHYCHFLENSVTVSRGQTVSAGKKIGEVGSTGRSSGPHLHYEIRVVPEDTNIDNIGKGGRNLYIGFHISPFPSITHPNYFLPIEMYGGPPQNRDVYCPESSTTPPDNGDNGTSPIPPPDNGDNGTSPIPPPDNGDGGIGPIPPPSEDARCDWIGDENTCFNADKIWGSRYINCKPASRENCEDDNDDDWWKIMMLNNKINWWDIDFDNGSDWWDIDFDNGHSIGGGICCCCDIDDDLSTKPDPKPEPERPGDEYVYCDRTYNDDVCYGGFEYGPGKDKDCRPVDGSYCEYGPENATCCCCK